MATPQTESGRINQASHPGSTDGPRFSETASDSGWDLVPSGIVLVDAAGQVTYLNDRARKMLQIPPLADLPQPLPDLVNDNSLIEYINSGRGEHALILSQGRLWAACRPLNTGRGPRGWIIALSDLSAALDAYEENAQLKEELSSLLENSYDGIIVAGPDRILEVNASFSRITGVPPTQLIGKEIKHLDANKHICLAAVQEVIRLTRYHKKSLTLQRRLHSGNEIFVTGSPVFDRHDQVTRVVLNVRDITDLKGLEDQIKKISVICTDPTEPRRPEAMREIVAESQPMVRLLELVMRVSQVNSTVLLQGESGVGKDVISRLIHNLSPRRNKPFVSVNCGAVPETLLESEFFGYEKGAFTNASKSGKPGLFEQSNGGTFFLDEVGELPLNLQVKLLKVLQDQRCRRVGGVRNISLDIRMVAATNKDLRAMVKEGQFREDLFYRLYVVPMEIAPLRERREDILPLALMVLNKFNAKYGSSHTLGHELMTVLESYDWPGNVRELQNVVERMVVTADADVLQARHLPNSIIQGSSQDGLLWMGGSLNLKKARDQVERHLIERAMAQTGNTRKASKLLGVDHSTVVRKAKKLGINLRQAAILESQDQVD